MADGRAPLLRLLQTLRPHRGRVLAATSWSILNKLFDLAPPALIGAAVDVVVRGQDALLAGLGLTDQRQQLWALAGLTVAIWILESLFEYLAAWYWRTLAQTVQHELRLQAYRHLQDQDLGWFAEQARGDLLAALNDDVNQLERFLDVGANELLQVATTVLAVGAAFFALAPGVAAASMLPIPLILWGSFRFQSRIGPRYGDVRRQAAKLNALLANNLHGFDTIKGFAAEERELARVAEASAAYQASNRRAIALSSAFSPVIRMAVMAGFLATLVYGGHQVLSGAISVGVYGTLTFLIQRLLWPLTRLGATFDLYQRAMASTERVLDLLAVERRVGDGELALDPAAVRGEVAFEGVTFAYPERGPLFQDFTLRLAPGRTTALVGATGAGKSTLISLLLRFHDPQAGRVTLDGRDVRELRLADLRRAVSLVPQAVFVFPGTARENITYGKPEASPAEVEQAARLTECHEFLSALPQGYDTVVGELGQRLSGGQRQRLALARAVLKGAPLLVLDEATSSVDNETEAAIQRSLSRISRGRTTLVIAHRLSTVRHADRIVVLEQGRLVEDGDHEALLAQDGVYARLWRVQTGEATQPV